jgi:hypothetical protein
MVTPPNLVLLLGVLHRMANNASGIDNHSHTSLIMTSRNFHLPGSQPLRYEIVLTAQGPATIDDPQTRGLIYDKTKPDSTLRNVNAQIVKEKQIDNLL